MDTKSDIQSIRLRYLASRKTVVSSNQDNNIKEKDVIVNTEILNPEIDSIHTGQDTFDQHNIPAKPIFDMNAALKIQKDTFNKFKSNEKVEKLKMKVKSEKTATVENTVENIEKRHWLQRSGDFMWNNMVRPLRWFCYKVCYIGQEAAIKGARGMMHGFIKGALMPVPE